MIKPVFLLAGRRAGDTSRPDPVLLKVFHDYGIANPRIAYSGTANGDDKGFFQRMAGEFKKAGAGEVIHAVISRSADPDKVSETFRDADIVFLSGGDVSQGMQKLEETKMDTFLRDLFLDGKPFFGLSAGAIMLAREWIRWTDPEDASTAELFPCLNFAPVIIDCHDDENDWEELRPALDLDYEAAEGFGLVSGSAIKVNPDGKVEALGLPVHHFVKQDDDIVRAEDIQPVE